MLSCFKTGELQRFLLTAFNFKKTNYNFLLEPLGLCSQRAFEFPRL